MSAAVEALPEGLCRDLRAAPAFPHDPNAQAGVDEIQTHLSHVFLTRDRVYKLHKARSLGFVDFGTRRLRNEDCLREVALNRRLAPDVYLGVAPVERGADGHFTVGPVGEDLAAGDRAEHVIVMRRLADGTDARSRLLAGDLDREPLRAVARRLARFHAGVGLGRPAPFSREDWLAVLAGPARANLDTLLEVALRETPRARVDAVRAALEARLVACAPDLERRRLDGRAVDGHGDAHLQHVFFDTDGADPVLIDCLAFGTALRHVDAASDVAFLSMDLIYLGRADLAADFLRTYAAEADDFHLYTVVDLHMSYRAGVRAKVAALATQDPAIAADQRAEAAGSAARHLALAERLLEPPEPAALVVMCGTVGSGKSSVAHALADAGQGVVLSSDRLRKHMAGLAPDAYAGAAPGEGLYAPAARDAVYAGLRDRADAVLRGGRMAIVDATHGTAARRAEMADWAAARGVRAHLVEVACDPAVARARLERRALAGHDPSDAGPELLDASRAGFEPPDEWPGPRHRVVTSDAGWREALPAID